MAATSNWACAGDSDKRLKDIGALGWWTVSSCKPGHGVDKLVDGNIKTLWQSEGPQPHLINIHFKKRQSICLVSLYADEDSDDSYTPHKLSIRAGTHHGDLIEISSKELYKPRGWQDIWLSLTKEVDKSYDSPVRAQLLQVAIVANHLSGKDTHVRGLRLFAPREPEFSSAEMPFTDNGMRAHATIR